MAEGVLGTLLGGEEEAPENAAAAEALAGADAYAVAMAIEQSRHDPKVAAATLVFLQQQSELLKAQTAQLNAERAIRLHHLHDQSRESRLRRNGQRLRLAMQAFTALIALLFGIGLNLLLHDAFTSQAVVVEAFETPAALAPTGVTGKVVAAGVLDALQKLADATRTTQKAMQSYSAWSSEIEIEVPETGVSVGEIHRLLQQRFGHDVRIGGDLVQTHEGGLALTIRGSGVAPKTFSGGAGDLEKLTVQAAEYVYGQSQPLAFAVYLTGCGRDREALAFLPGAFSRATADTLRSNLANSWGNAFLNLNEQAQAAGKFRLAMTLDPSNWVPRMNLLAALPIAEGEESAWRASHDLLEAISAAKGHGPDKRLLQNAAGLVWDLPLLLEADLADLAYNKGAGAITVPDAPYIADAYGMMHDAASAARYLAASDPAEPYTKAEDLILQVYAALDRHDAAAALPPMEAFWKSWQASAMLKSVDTDYACLLVLVYGLAGRPADARSVFERAGRWNRCYAFYGYALAQAHDLDGARRVWADGQGIAPDLPFVYLYRGLTEAATGAPREAADDFAAANRCAPHLAEPLKAWGDLLASEGRWADARAKYEEGLRYAPNWAEMKQARDAAARKA